MLSKLAKGSYTYEDYVKLDEGMRCEIIDGIIYNMSPAPTTAHQSAVGFLFATLWNYLQDKPCRVFVAPFDVFLLGEGLDISQCDKIVQPDISVICNEGKITEKGCVGAPDFIIEVVSSYNKVQDYVRKLNLYNDFSVREYWIVNPETKTVLKYVSEGEGFSEPTQFSFCDEVKAEVLEGLVVDFRGYRG